MPFSVKPLVSTSSTRGFTRTHHMQRPALNVAQFLRSLLRRPIALMLLAMSAAVAGYAGFTSTSATYESTAVAVVIPPGSGSTDAMLNPLINLDNDMAQLAAVVATSIQAEGGVAAATGAGGTGNFTVDTIYGDASMYAQLSSQLVITAQGPDPESARSAAAALVEYARTCLNKLQLDSAVPVVNNALLIPSVEPSDGTKIPTSGVRAAASYALGAALICLLILMIADAIREVVRRRRRPAAPERPDDPDPAPFTDIGGADLGGDTLFRSTSALYDLTPHDDGGPGRHRRSVGINDNH
ncbi:hypothetical protein KL953_06850 [Mycolicibacterium goodii]|uniref:hypothetical protein n=1 Tax=Mycolicibacterium goodii TaxID=134601 RepID=UPI001BDCF75D|nr:hypothetical protein [Mycolicibacterium goodii]MBU8808610.1 hypothetical protein [Mycolicibacterium goodii]